MTARGLPCITAPSNGPLEISVFKNPSAVSASSLITQLSTVYSGTGLLPHCWASYLLFPVFLTHPHSLKSLCISTAELFKCLLQKHPGLHHIYNASLIVNTALPQRDAVATEPLSPSLLIKTLFPLLRRGRLNIRDEEEINEPHISRLRDFKNGTVRSAMGYLVKEIDMVIEGTII